MNLLSRKIRAVDVGQNHRFDLLFNRHSRRFELLFYASNLACFSMENE